jgi:hypothetical protein
MTSQPRCSLSRNLRINETEKWYEVPFEAVDILCGLFLFCKTRIVQLLFNIIPIQRAKFIQQWEHLKIRLKHALFCYPELEFKPVDFILNL